MNKIHHLAPDITSKIAAGEVIERPAYAVKELIENSIDANSSYIGIEIINAGLDRIMITDNGHGIEKEDVLLAYLPHTTSKIKDEDDLHSIKSLGFRGEALSSIASISQLTLQSKPKDQVAGTKVVIRSSQLQETEPVGMPMGTKVIVENLFANVPVRKKFLKSTRTEFRMIVDIVTNAALAYPNIGFVLLHNEKQILLLPENQSISDRISTLLGQTVTNNSIPFSLDESYISLSGFLGKPQVTFNNQNKLIFLVNNRRVYDPLLASSIKESYGNLLEKYTFPFALINIKVPFEFVDVNIHPRKEQIKFSDPHLVAFALSKAIHQSLEDNNLTFFNVSWKQGLTKTPMALKLRQELSNIPIAQLAKENKESDIAQIHNLYLVVETDLGMMFIDQHAAHEAILFDELKQKYLEEKKLGVSIQLPHAIFVELSVSEMQVLQEFEDYFLNLGFIIEEFGSNTIKISHVPAFFRDFDLGALFAEILADFVNQEFPKSIDDRSEKMLAYIACRNAIKAGESLDKQQKEKLIGSLQEHHYTYTCPHGRPVKIEFSLQEVDILFKRK